MGLKFQHLSGLRAHGVVIKRLLAVLLVVGLTACGGGNESGAASPVDDAETSGTVTTSATDRLAKASELNTQELAAAALQEEIAVASGAVLPAPQMLGKASARTPVYRFYNGLTGAHFYTISAAERDTVQATLPQFSFEGAAFFVSPLADAGLSPVYRFFNSQTGVHFYSISADEKAYIQANLPQFGYEGVAYYASQTAQSGMVPLYRFFVTTRGFHFYTANEAEKDRIRSTLAHYAFENVGYYVMNSAAEPFTVGGTVSGLAAGGSLVLRNNAGPDLALTANGAFTFPAPVNPGGVYSVSVVSQPSGQTCSVIGGSGAAAADVTSVLVQCAASQFGVSVMVGGLGAGSSVVLQLNGDNDLTVGPVPGGAARAQFSTAMSYGSAFSVTVKTQPAGQTCSVSNGSGSITGAMNVNVQCSVNAYGVGGSVSGLGTGKSLTLQLNGGASLMRSANGVFTFSGLVAQGSLYAVTVTTQPVGQICTVNNASGTVSGPVSDVAVNCATATFGVGGSVTGLLGGKTLILQNNSGNDLMRSSNGAFTFSAPVAFGSAYSVTVRTQPIGQTCSVSNGAGTVSSTVSNVQVICGVNVYSVSGSISGLGASQSVVLQNNAGNDLTLAQNGNFGFSQLLTYGSPYVVTVKTQPPDQTCSVSSGMGTVTGTQGSVLVSCADHVSVGGTVSGLIAGNPVVLTLNGGGDLSVNGNGGFAFATKTPLGSTYVVGVKAQPAGQTCAVSNSSGIASAEVANVSVSCVNHALPDLVISEVGGCPYLNSGCWLEVYNPTATARNLVNYRLRAGSSVPAVFALPNAVVAPGEYRILAGHVSSEAPVTALNTVVMVGGSGGVPDWYTTGLVELISASGNTTVDAVRFGASYAPQPLSAGHWSGASAPGGFVGSANDAPRSLVRPVAHIGSQDTNSALDWVAVDFATPGGPNDVAPGAVDADDDGLPDGNELPASTFNGLDLYSMGARVNQPDIFVEVDHMSSSKAGVIPQLASMQKVKDAFALRGIALHIDVGTLFSPGFAPAQFNLGQGDGTVPYQPCVGFDVGSCSGNSSVNYRTVYDWKWQHFNPRRRGVFHYALFADADSSGGAWGRGELFGNDFVVSMGNLTAVSDFLINQQANTFMHELGHNLGLQHGGNEDVNYKPNYLSVMNYLSNGVSPGNSVWPYKDWKDTFGSSVVTCYPGATHPLCTATPVPFVVGYSDGSGLPLNESALFESANVGRGALPGVYADWDENGALTTTALSKDLNGDGVLGMLTDHNDWAAVTLPFARYYSGELLRKSVRAGVARKAAKVPVTGAAVPDPLLSDRGPTVITCGQGLRSTPTVRSSPRSKGLGARGVSTTGLR